MITRPRLLVALLVSACALVAAPTAGAAKPKVDLTRAGECDFIGEQRRSQCLLPFPDDYYTVREESTRTGRRVDLKTSAMPENSQGVHVDAGPYNLNDGFSPGQTIVARVPGLDNPEALAETNAVPLNHLGEYKRRGAPIVVIDAKTGKRWPIWVEIDSNAESAEETSLLIHPAKNFHQRHRYIVAMRKLKTADGERISAPPGFRYYRDDIASDEEAINRQRDRFDDIFATLRRADIRRRNLYLAWDFTVASDRNIAERMLYIRNNAFRLLGDTELANLEVEGRAPDFEVTSVEDFTPAEDPNVAREIDGNFTVPCYLHPDCAPGSRFELGENGLPRGNGAWVANFKCIVPRVALETPGRPSLYGHGLLGSADEAFSDPQRTLAQNHNFVTCATDEIGFSENDIPNIVGILRDFSDFPELTDRVQQGLLNELYLGRLMIHTDGFPSDPAFQDGGAPVIDTGRLYYNGNSQGGILGGALTAVAPDFTRAALGVPAMNYPVLLNRSVDFDTYALIFDPAYPNKATQQLILSLSQMLWDRSEPNGYAHRMTDHPIGDTPAHEVLLNVAFGDHQVTTWQADVEARTIGARAHAPVVYEGRWPGVDVLWRIPRISSYPYRGSAIVYWDSGPPRPDPEDPSETIGTDPPPIENVPNRTGEDPHEDPRRALAEQQMVSDFLRPNDESHITDTCNGKPCYAGSFNGPYYPGGPRRP